MNFNDVVKALIPTDFWGILLYIVLIMDILTMFLQKESSLLLTIFLAISILSAIMNELGVNSRANGVDLGTGIFKQVLQTNGTSFANWLISILMVVCPLIVVGMTKTGRSRGPGLLGVLAAALFVFGRWVFSQITHTPL